MKREEQWVTMSDVEAFGGKEEWNNSGNSDSRFPSIDASSTIEGKSATTQPSHVQNMYVFLPLSKFLSAR
jgi:hypothetical protein